MIQYDDFIGIYDGVYPENYCDHLISEFDRLKKLGAGRDRSKEALESEKNDWSIFFTVKNYDFDNFNGDSVVDVFFKGLQLCYDQYTSKFSILKQPKIHAKTMKVQCTDPGGGYHIWHCEQGPSNIERVLVYMLYLNTLNEKDGGETEFLYQKKRYNPIKNRVIIWPANFTHAHRGNTVLGNDSKYIVTGWFYYE